MIDPQELEAAAKDMMQRAGHKSASVDFCVRVNGDSTRTHFWVASGDYTESGKSSCLADSLGVAVEKCVADVHHNRRTELEKARERVRILEAQAAT